MQVVHARPLVFLDVVFVLFHEVLVKYLDHFFVVLRAILLLDGFGPVEPGLLLIIHFPHDLLFRRRRFPDVLLRYTGSLAYFVIHHFFPGLNLRRLHSLNIPHLKLKGLAYIGLLSSGLGVLGLSGRRETHLLRSADGVGNSNLFLISLDEFLGRIWRRRNSGVVTLVHFLAGMFGCLLVVGNSGLEHLDAVDHGHVFLLQHSDFLVFLPNHLVQLISVLVGSLTLNHQFVDLLLETHLLSLLLLNLGRGLGEFFSKLPDFPLSILQVLNDGLHLQLELVFGVDRVIFHQVVVHLFEEFEVLVDVDMVFLLFLTLIVHMFGVLSRRLEFENHLFGPLISSLLLVLLLVEVVHRVQNFLLLVDFLHFFEVVLGRFYFRRRLVRFLELGRVLGQESQSYPTSWSQGIFQR